jgi:short-subunit dehydrogenase
MNKTALITEASNGIGYELAKVHVSKGDNLVLVALSKSKLFERKNIASSKEVAGYGYRQGRAVAIHGFRNTLLANSVRFAPRSLVVKFARKIQEKKY